MLVAKNKVVSFLYTVTDDNGKVLDKTEKGNPFSYLHGAGQIIPGLEKEMEGKNINDHFSVHVNANDAYGSYDNSLVMKLDRSYFGSEHLEKGLQLQIQSQDGIHIVTVVDFTDNEVTIDANHPLAGINLNFDIEIKDVRDASEEEIAHGHAHSDDFDEHEIDFEEDEGSEEKQE